MILVIDFVLLMESSRAVIWAAFFSFVIAFVFVFFVFYRQRRELYFQQKEADLGRQVAEVEMKALRAQMNPHFIFNALNSVYRFMENNDLKNAGDYLLKVSALMRMILENSLNKSIPLEDELKALNLYIEIEQMRMQNSFRFNVNLTDDIYPESTFVPPLIAQPFIENAIWHGLKNKSHDGQLTIDISKSNSMLLFSIEDNGGIESIENNTSPIHEAKKKSLGLSLTQERLEVLNRTKNSNASFTIDDKKDETGNYLGKKVVLSLPLEEL